MRTNMKKLLVLFCLLWAGAAQAQWQVPVNTIPMGKGTGKTGFATVSGSGGAGTKCLLDTAPPTFGTCNAAITGAALTKTDDTNVTLTLGGSPNSALINAASLTLGWTGTLAFARGGCNAATQVACRNNIFPTPTRAGDIAYWNGTIWTSLAGNNSGTKILQEDASGVPSWASAGGVTSVATAGLATGGPITSTGTITVTAAVQSDQETGTSNTVAVTPGTQKFHPLSAKVVAYVSQSAGTYTLQTAASFGATSISKIGTGVVDVTLTTAMSGTSNFGALATSNTGGILCSEVVGNRTTTNVRVDCRTPNTAANVDSNFTLVVFGDM